MPTPPPETRQRLIERGKLPTPGHGPSAEVRERSWFRNFVVCEAAYVGGGSGSGGGGGGGRYCTTTPGGPSNPLLLSSSRKRRRGGGFFAAAAGGVDCPDPNRAAPSTLDVTVSGPPPSSSDPAFVRGGGGGTIVLLAYVHLHTVATRPPSGTCEGRRDGGTTLTGFSRLVMSRDAMREMGIVGDGRAKNLRLYGAVIIPPPSSAAASAERTDADGDGANRDGDELRMIGRLSTIVCTNVCREYPVDQPPLRDVSFDGFSSTVM
jgi:hypothetical protein